MAAFWEYNITSLATSSVKEMNDALYNSVRTRTHERTHTISIPRLPRELMGGRCWVRTTAEQIYTSTNPLNHPWLLKPANVNIKVRARPYSSDDSLIDSSIDC